MYLLAGLTALLFRALGVLPVGVLEGILIASIGIGTSGLVALCIVRAPSLYRPLHVDALWLALDVLLVTWAVASTGGLESPWFIWYIANAGSAAFAKGRRATLLVSLADFVCYLGVLTLLGEIGFFDRPFLVALARLVFLHTAAFFFVRGAADLAARRLEIRRLRDEDGRRLADLERLAAALDQRTRELSAANRQVREADRQKSRFLANVSHELRTPLNSILGFSQILSTRFADDLPERPRRFLGNIRTSGEHLLKVLDDVLDLSKIEAGRMTLSPETLDVAALVDEAAGEAQGQGASRGVTIVTDASGLPPLEADRLKVKQVLLNLLANAVRYSPDGGTVTVRGELVGETIRLSVRDEGIGIAAEDQPLIFDEFRQARRRSVAGGTGLGLALVKSLVELHGGSVGLLSAPGKGSTFRIELPIRFRGIAERPIADSSSGEVPALPAARVLIVSDGPASALRAAIEDAGCLALTTGAGRDALRLTRTLHPAALVLDLDGSGAWPLLRATRADAETREIPVVLCVLPAPGRCAALSTQDHPHPDLDAPGAEEAVRRQLACRAETAPLDEAAAAALVVDVARRAAAEGRG